VKTVASEAGEFELAVPRAFFDLAHRSSLRAQADPAAGR
jgi:hypothetical protein